MIFFAIAAWAIFFAISWEIEMAQRRRNSAMWSAIARRALDYVPAESEEEEDW